MAFPKGFVWGAAAAAYQVEGAAYEDGKGLSVWDTFCKRKNAIWSAHHGDVACDHYHRYREDVGLMKQMGLQAYRLSVSWPRVIPNGTGSVNAKGLDFYSRLVDELLGAGISPYVTLFHWDYPYELYCRGHWMNPDSSKWFADYTQVVVDALSDRVKHWFTLNEPQVFIGLGHQNGIHAPGDKLDMRHLLRIGHNVLLSHGRATQVIRSRSKQAALVGYAPVAVVKSPASERPEDIKAARDASMSCAEGNLWNNTWWMDPVYLGKYPEDGLKVYAADLPEIGADDMATIHQPVDFCGFNIYFGDRVEADANGKTRTVEYPVGYPRTLIRWPVTPESIYWGAKFMHERYGKPIYVTENGLSNQDWIHLDGQVHDSQRIDFLTRYLREFRRAGEDGIDIRGYFQWSIMDNFEWAEGYRERFGLIFVDYPTQKRVLKDSAHWYAELIKDNGAKL